MSETSEPVGEPEAVPADGEEVAAPEVEAPEGETAPEPEGE